MYEAVFTHLPEMVGACPVGLDAGVKGWLTTDEGAALFLLASTTEGAVLEVGPWLGRSTVCIAKGVATSIANGGGPRPFTTVELNPTAANWLRDDNDIMHFFPDPSEGPVGGTPIKDWERNIAPVVNQPGGVIGALRDNLAITGVAPLVRVLEGDFRDHALGASSYGMVFTDAMHTPDEVHRYGPALAGLLAEGGVLACHDTSPENREALGEHVAFRAEWTVGGLFAGLT